MINENTTFRDPTPHLIVPNWPKGRDTVRAEFRVVSHPDGSEWVYRVTGGKQRLSPRVERTRIVRGSDGRHYVVGRAKNGRCFVMPGTMRALCWLASNSKLTNAINEVLE